MRRANEPRLVRVIADELDIDRNLVGLQQKLGAGRRQLADAARAQAATDDDGLRVAPARDLDEALDDRRQRLGEFLDRAVDDAARLRVPVDEELIELLLLKL